MLIPFCYWVDLVALFILYQNLCVVLFLSVLKYSYNKMSLNVLFNSFFKF